MAAVEFDTWAKQKHGDLINPETHHETLCASLSPWLIGDKGNLISYTRLCA